MHLGVHNYATGIQFSLGGMSPPDPGAVLLLGMATISLPTQHVAEPKRWFFG